MIGWSRRRSARTRTRTQRQRRGGPVGESQWWDPDDQELVESDLITKRALGRGWRAMPMLNNVEHLDPYGDSPAAERLRAVRAERVLTALDEGRAWRRSATGALLVLRAEMFAEPGAAHRDLWQAVGTEVLTETWRQRWREREREPGWIEAVWTPEEASESPCRDDLDWIRIEDHTGDGDDVLVYHHVTVWAARLHAVVTLRLPLGEPVDRAVHGAAASLHQIGISRRSGTDLGSV